MDSIGTGRILPRGWKLAMRGILKGNRRTLPKWPEKLMNNTENQKTRKRRTTIKHEKTEKLENGEM